jgi:hypothetical protein
LDGLAALVDHSLVQREETSDGEPRFRMLETVREYALERLEASEEIDAVRAQHAAYFAALAEQGKLTWWLRPEMAGEQPNVRAALAWAVEHGAAERMLSLAIALWQFIEPAGDYDRLERVLAATAQVPPSLRSKRVLLLAGTAQFALWRGNAARTTALIDECLTRAGGRRRGTRRPGHAVPRLDRGWVGRPGSRRHVRRGRVDPVAASG